MTMRLKFALMAAAMLAAQPAAAANPMGYQMVTAQDAAGLPHNHGALGLEVGRSQQITDSGLTFDIMGIKAVRPGSAGAQAGLVVGDQIIAIDGHVFPTIATFAAYVGSMAPGSQTSVDYMPRGTGPQQAPRLTVTVGAAGAPMPAAHPAPVSGGMSTGTKVAIGVGAVALLGCYEMGCFTHRPTPPVPQP